MSNTTMDSANTLEVRLENQPPMNVVRPLQNRALQWFTHVVVIQTDKAGGTPRWRVAMNDVRELV
eukprot:3790186-Prorocentrum_lima.AAC.1